MNKTYKYLLPLVILAFLATESDAQRWKRYRHEVWGGLGGTNFLGELGGANEEAKDLVIDFDVKSSRYVIAGGYRYKLTEIVAARASLYGGMISGSDEFTNDPFRQSRNLSFRAPIVELSGVLEVYFLKEKVSNRYRVRGIKGKLGNNLSAYGFGGVGGLWFNPQGEYNGKWYSLQPLGTEGQGIEPGVDKYKRITMTFPMGIGAKYNINRNWALGLEYGVRLTRSDYLDDVSTEYYDPAAIAAANGSDGEAAAFLSNPQVELDLETYGDRFAVTRPGEQRGDKTTNDTYMFAVLSLNYKLISRKTNRPKF